MPLLDNFFVSFTLRPVEYDPPRRIELRGRNNYWSMALRNGALVVIAIGVCLLFHVTEWWDRWTALKFVAFILLSGAVTLAWANFRRGKRPSYPKEKIVFTPEGISTYHRADAAVRHYATERLARLSVLRSGNAYQFHC